MIIRVNGRELALDPAPVMACSAPEIPPLTNRLKEWALAILEAFSKATAGILMAGVALPSGGPIDKLWPLITKMQDFGLPIGIGFALWGVYMLMFGNPEGKTKFYQALIGFVGLFIVPEFFIAIWQAFRG